MVSEEAGFEANTDEVTEGMDCEVDCDVSERGRMCSWKGADRWGEMNLSHMESVNETKIITGKLRKVKLRGCAQSRRLAFQT